MIRLTGLWLFVGILSIYAWRKDWFVPLCGLVFLTAFTEHPDMPNKVLGIPGLNPWNLLCANVVLAWAVSRRAQGYVWDMPRHIAWSFVAFFIVLLASAIPLLSDPESIGKGATLGDILIDFILNPVKFVIPGLLLYDGCRSRFQTSFALIAIVAVYVMIAIQVINYMPPGAVTWGGAELSKMGNRIIRSTVGYSRVTVSMMLAGAFWAAVAVAQLGRTIKWRWSWYGAALTTLYGQALTGGRAGYLTWGLLGLVFCMIRYRRLLLVLPVIALGIVTVIPGVRERLLMGFASDQGKIVAHNSTEVMTSGRTQVWPYVIEKIQEAPIFGYGRMAMVSTGLSRFLTEQVFGYEDFGHAHNAYLSQLLETGIVGFLGVIPIYVLAAWSGIRLLRVRNDPVCTAAGGVGAALVLALLLAGLGSHFLVPMASTVGMWAAVGVTFRLGMERRRFLHSGDPMFGESAVDVVDAVPEPAATV